MCKINVVKKGTARGEYIGRGSVLGNPFLMVKDGGTYTREGCIAAFEVMLKEKLTKKDPAFCGEMNRLFKIAKEKGELTLVCFCKPLGCHGDVVKQILEEKLG